MSESAVLERVGPEQKQIAGILRDPITTFTGNAAQTTFHWEADDGRHTFLYLTLRRDERYPDGVVANTNIDSRDVKGQGWALWSFLGNTLQNLSNEQQVLVFHEVQPNDHSRRLPLEDPRYQTFDGGQTFVGLYSPEPPHPPVE